MSKLEEELLIIFKKYKKRFKLGIRIYFNEGWGCKYCHNQYINIDFDYICEAYDSERVMTRYKYNSFRELAIIVLLHEIGHTIDYKYNKRDYMKELDKQIIAERNNIPFTKHLIKKYYPLEAKADEFAKIEQRKWK